MTSKNLQQCYTLKCLIGKLLSNIIFSQNSANVLLLSHGSGGRGGGGQRMRRVQICCVIFVLVSLVICTLQGRVV